MNATYFKPEWSPFTVLAMILGFIVFWPIGLAVLAYVLWGERFGWSGNGDRADRWANKQKQWAGWCQGRNGNSRQSFGFSQSTGNAAFDDYRAEQLRRLEEERKKLDEEVGQFHEYLRNLRMARDREEFDRYMRDRQSNRPTTGSDGNTQNGNSQNGNPTGF